MILSLPKFYLTIHLTNSRTKKQYGILIKFAAKVAHENTAFLAATKQVIKHKETHMKDAFYLSKIRTPGSNFAY